MKKQNRNAMIVGLWLIAFSAGALIVDHYYFSRSLDRLDASMDRMETSVEKIVGLNSSGLICEDMGPVQFPRICDDRWHQAKLSQWSSPHVLPGTLPVDEPTRALAKKHEKSIVEVASMKRTSYGARSVSFGTGVIINDAGDVLTAFHVIDDADLVRVRRVQWNDTSGSNGHHWQTVKEFDFSDSFARIGRRDLAIIRDLNLGDDVQAMPIAEAAPKEGDRLTLLGLTSDAVHGSAFTEIGSALEAFVLPKPRMVNVWIPTWLGDSGGPFINAAGEVVGIAHSIPDGGQTTAEPVHGIRHLLAPPVK